MKMFNCTIVPPPRHQHPWCLHLFLSFLLMLLMQTLSTGFPDQCNQLVLYRENLSSFQSLRWDQYWKLHVLPLIAPQSVSTSEPSSDISPEFTIQNKLLYIHVQWIRI